MVDRLFVYGTLAPGRPNAHVLAAVPGTWERATVRGRLVDGGWGAALGYPGIVPSRDGEPGDAVDGFVFSSPELRTHWHRLDEFEGTGYRRVVVKAALEDGRIVDAHAYALTRDGTVIDEAS